MRGCHAACFSFAAAGQTITAKLCLTLSSPKQVLTTYAYARCGRGCKATSGMAARGAREGLWLEQTLSDPNSISNFNKLQNGRMRAGVHSHFYVVTLFSRPSSLVPRPSSLVPRPSSLVPRPSSLVPRPSSLLHKISDSDLMKNDLMMFI